MRRIRKHALAETDLIDISSTAIGQAIRFVERDTRLGGSACQPDAYVGATCASACHLKVVFPSIAAADGDLHEPAAACSR
jgi:hypothetical protein